MNDDLDLANLLGEAPAAVADPVFRYDVLARAASRARRRASLQRALDQVAVFAAIGLVFLLRAAGLSSDTAQPVALAGGVLAAAALVGVLSLYGPRGALALAPSLGAGAPPLMRRVGRL